MQAEHTIDLPWLVLVGGFLGAGKSTLLIAAGRELERRGMRSAIILNDQGDALVDTDLITRAGFAAGEVTGGCFCCRFSGLIDALDRLRAHAPAVIFAEPVGSCIDISATTLHPLREHAGRYRIAPYTVLIDPARGRSLLAEGADLDLRYLFRKQIEEADLVCLSKSDLYSEPFGAPELDIRKSRHISAKTGQGVAAWLDEVLSGTLSSGSVLLDVDYERYAQAEAALVWLNLQTNLLWSEPRSHAMILGPLLEALDRELTSGGMDIVHLKAIVSSRSQYLKGALCGNGQSPTVEGAFDASPEMSHDLLLNLRSLGSAEAAREIVERCLSDLGAAANKPQIACFHPAAPQPERRIVRNTSAVAAAEV